MCLDCLLLGVYCLCLLPANAALIALLKQILNAILDQTYPTMEDGEKIVALTFRYTHTCMCVSPIKNVPSGWK